MSKPTARIVLVSLIAVVLVAAAYLTVQGAFAKAESAGAQAHVVELRGELPLHRHRLDQSPLSYALRR